MEIPQTFRHVLTASDYFSKFNLISIDLFYFLCVTSITLNYRLLSRYHNWYLLP